VRRRNSVEVVHPLWEEVRFLDREAARRSHGNHSPGLGALGLILDSPLDRSRYDFCTPLNCRTFAHTGGNGVHFSFLMRANRINGRSPVIVTNPSPCNYRQVAVGANLYDFLCLGIRFGYFAMEQFSFGREEALAIYASRTWEPKTEQDYRVGFGVDEHQQRLLDLLIERLDLVPWKAPKRRFRQLQKEIVPLLKTPEMDEMWGLDKR
jgi:hypothetical protein